MSLLNRFSFRYIFSLLFAAFMFSCGDSDSFTVEGTVDGNATINLRFLYSANGSLQRGLTAARDGKFEFHGVAPAPTLLEILDNDYRLLGRLFVVNGDRIECHLVRNHPYSLTVSGSDVSERWAAFLNDNSESLISNPNPVIENYVSRNPGDIVSTLLMLTSYDSSMDALRADSVMAGINSDVRPSSLVDGFNTLLQRLVTSSATDTISPIQGINMRDSLVAFDPARRPLSLLIISDGTSGRADSIVPVLKQLHRKSLRSSLQLTDIAVDIDTLSWHKSIRPDSASWQQIWVAGSLSSPGVDRLGVPRVPYFIVTDSAGCQLLRTTSVRHAESFIDSCLTSNN